MNTEDDEFARIEREAAMKAPVLPTQEKNMKNEALKLALDYIVATNKSSQFWLVPESNLNKTVTAIKQALAAPVQEPVALFKWLPEGATHIGRISVRTAAGGSLAMTTHAFKYDSAVLKVYVTDNDNEYPGWRDAKDCFFHLNFPVLPLYTSPQPAQRTWVGLTDEEVMEIAFNFDVPSLVVRTAEAKLKEKNT